MLDEPTSGLDQPGEAGFYRLIEAVRAQTGAAVLMVSHDLHVVMAASDRVICLNHHICCEGTPRVVSAAPGYRALFGLGTQGALALYQHLHDHSHDGHDHGHVPAVGGEVAGLDLHAHGHHDHGPASFVAAPGPARGRAGRGEGHPPHDGHQHTPSRDGPEGGSPRVEVPDQVRDGLERGDAPQPHEKGHSHA